MVRALEQDVPQESYMSKLFVPFRGRHAKSLSIESASKLEASPSTPTEEESPATCRSQGSTPLNDDSERLKKELDQVVRDAKEAREKLNQEMDQMKERFAKLLLGEDMSGGGKGVSSALALSNAFTNLAASVFGEQRKLEPMPPERKSKWKKEIAWLLSVTDYIVEMVPSQQINKDGSNMEIMTTRQRKDLHMNIPALKKLDTMLIDCLDNFKDQCEFYYVKKDSNESNDDGPKRKDDDKWWLPMPKVPPEGLSDNSRKFLQHQKDCVNQVLKAAMAINAQVLSEIEIPESYIEALPKNGRASLGDSNYKSITVEYFDPDQFLTTMDLSSEHKILDLKNRIEASIVIWQRKMTQKDSKSSWSSGVSIEKRELFEERAETILLLLKQRFPGLPQSSLEISKIQFNRDVGQAVLESYSRILESLASTVLSRIEDVLHADYQTQNPTKNTKKAALRSLPHIPKSDNPPPPAEEDDQIENEAGTPASMTLLDFMGWGNDQGGGGDADAKKDPAEDLSKDADGKMQKLPNIETNNKKGSYLENLGGVRSPTSRH